MRVLRVAELAAAEAETRELIVVVACWWWCMVWSSFYDGIPLEVYPIRFVARAEEAKEEEEEREMFRAAFLRSLFRRLCRRGMIFLRRRR